MTRRQSMKTDVEIKEDVIRELRWDPEVPQAEAIGVALEDGVATLTGHASTYGEKLAAEKAAARVYGVKAVANRMEVRLAGARKDDTDIARAISHVIEWNTNIPADQVKARVDEGWVTLDGAVDYGFQRKEVERMVRHVTGVVGIADNIRVRPPVSEAQVEAKIADAMRRNAELDARSIKVEFSDDTARLYGHVHSLHEELAARVAAAASPGVARVESHLQVVP